MTKPNTPTSSASRRQFLKSTAVAAGAVATQLTLPALNAAGSDRIIESIRTGKPYNELKSVAESTLTAIMGRMSAYTGKRITWEQALNSREDLMPQNLAWDTPVPLSPVATPGKTPLVWYTCRLATLRTSVFGPDACAKRR